MDAVVFSCFCLLRLSLVFFCFPLFFYMFRCFVALRCFCLVYPTLRPLIVVGGANNERGGPGSGFAGPGGGFLDFSSRSCLP